MMIIGDNCYHIYFLSEFHFVTFIQNEHTDPGIRLASIHATKQASNSLSLTRISQNKRDIAEFLIEWVYTTISYLYNSARYDK